MSTLRVNAITLVLVVAIFGGIPALIIAFCPTISDWLWITLLSIGGGVTFSFLWSFAMSWAMIPRAARCRSCCSTNTYRRQDGGHDYVEGCRDCGVEFGVQDAPFNIVARIQ